MMRKQVIRACPVCATRAADLLHHQSFAGYDASPLPTAYGVVACTRCGFAYADTPASQADYDRYYRDYSKYEDTQVSSGSGLHDWESARFRQTAADIARLIPDRNAALLDVGSANGGLLTELERLGYHRLNAMDHAPACVQAVANKGFAAFLGGVTEPPPTIAGRHFDGVLLSHVLEHLRDLEGALRHCAQWLNEGGILYLETPDAARYPDFTIVPYYFFDCEHINHFSLGSLCNLAQRYGFAFIEGASKTFLASSTTRYPAVWAAFRRSRAAPRRPPIFDPDARDGILAHIHQSRTTLAMPEIERLAAQCVPVIVWGAGSFAQRLLENSALGRCKIRYFVDNDRSKEGKQIYGIEIRVPEEIDQRDAPILVCVALFSHDVLAQIASMGLPNPVIQLGRPAGDLGS